MRQHPIKTSRTENVRMYIIYIYIQQLKNVYLGRFFIITYSLQYSGERFNELYYDIVVACNIISLIRACFYVRHSYNNNIVCLIVSENIFCWIIFQRFGHIILFPNPNISAEWWNVCDYFDSANEIHVLYFYLHFINIFSIVFI